MSGCTLQQVLPGNWVSSQSDTHETVHHMHVCRASSCKTLSNTCLIYWQALHSIGSDSLNAPHPHTVPHIPQATPLHNPWQCARSSPHH
jgi:hypothetical protein